MSIAAIIEKYIQIEEDIFGVEQARYISNAHFPALKAELETLRRDEAMDEAVDFGIWLIGFSMTRNEVADLYNKFKNQQTKEQ